MTDTRIENPYSMDSGQRPGPSLLFLIGAFLWVLCLLALVAGWYQWRMVRAIQAEPTVPVTSDDDGRPQKTIKLVPQKDGSLVPMEVTKDEEANPWDATGIEDFSFTDTNGQTVTKKDLIGKPFVIAFVFTKCAGPCPNVTRQMRELQDRLKEFDFNLVTLTVDPERDSSEILQNYGKANGADFDRWKFLTGDQADIYGLIHRSFKMPVEEAKGEKRIPGFEIIHSTNIMLINAEGLVIGKFNAQKDDEMSKLRRELKKVARPRVSDLESGKPFDSTEKKDGN